MNIGMTAFRQILTIATIIGVVALFPLCLLDADLLRAGYNPSLCPLTVQDHVDFLQQVVVPLPRLLGVLVLVAIVLTFLSLGRVIPVVLVTSAFHIRRSSQRQAALFGRSYLLEQLSAGILHPKTY